jgi:hypothetical protein
MSGLVRAWNDVLKAELDLCRTAAQRISVCERLVENMKKLEAIAKMKYQRALGTNADYLESKAARLEAELELQRERANADVVGKSQPAALKPPAKGSLRYDGKSFDQWQEELRTELKPERRTEAIKAFAAFGAHGYGEEATRAIVEVMREYDVLTVERSTEGHLKLAAIDAFKAEGRTTDGITRPIDPVAAVPVLSRELKHGNRNSRRFAARVLQEIGQHAQAALPALMDVVSGDDDSNTRLAAVRAVAAIDESGEKIASALRQMFAQGDPQIIHDVLEFVVPASLPRRVANAAGWTIFQPRTPPIRGGVRAPGPGAWQRQLAPKAQPVLKVLIEAIEDGQPAVRCEVIEALGRIGPEAKEAIPLFKEAAKDEDEKVRKAAERALKAISEAADQPAPRSSPGYRPGVH